MKRSDSPLLKTCEVCGDSFSPEARARHRQRVCRKLGCRQQRKRQAQQRWITNNPGCFKGRYVKLQAWLVRHPGYLANYRRARKSRLVATDGDIQDELSPCQNEEPPHARDIQDDLSSKITKRSQALTGLHALLSDMQDELNALELELNAP